jgi:methyl-accepting chemotaxis protein
MTSASTLDDLAVFLESVSGETRDLTLTLKGEDRLAKAVNDSTRAFESLALDMLKSVTHVSGVVGSLDREVQSLDASISSQGARLAEATGVVRRNSEGTVALAEAAKTVSIGTAAVGARTAENESFMAKIASSLDSLGSLVLKSENFMSRLVTALSTIDSQIASLADISERLSILAINTAIEAARAGEKGRGFSIIAKEMQSLAKTALGETRVVVGSVSAVRGEVRGMSSSLVSSETSVRDSIGDSASIAARFLEIKGAVKELEGALASQSSAISSQAQTAQALAAGLAAISEENERVSERAREAEAISAGLEGMVSSSIEHLGRYTTSLHKKALAGLEDFARRRPSLESFMSDPDPALSSLFSACPWFELLYLMDPNGTQVSSNVVNPAYASMVSSEGRGKSWRDRPYFSVPAGTGRGYISEIYMSVASKKLCLTVSVPLLRADSSLAGILAADLDVGDLFSVA